MHRTDLELLGKLPIDVYDEELNRICLNDIVRLPNGQEGKVVFEAGAYGVAVADVIDWDSMAKKINYPDMNSPDFCFCDNFVSFWELLWNCGADEVISGLKVVGHEVDD